jgi:hypothetical protein
MFLRSGWCSGLPAVFDEEERDVVGLGGALSEAVESGEQRGLECGCAVGGGGLDQGEQTFLAELLAGLAFGICEAVRINDEDVAR